MSSLHTTSALISPKQAAQAIGVSESSLKRWCDNGKINVSRTPGGHRKMSVADLFDFVRSNDVPLAAPELLGLPKSTGKKEIDTTQVQSELTRALLAADELLVQQLAFDLLINKVPLHNFFDDFLAPSTYEIGRQWECNQADIYQERMSCEIIVRLLHQIRNLIPITRNDFIAIGGTLSNDNYAIPTTMVELILRNHGINATSMGTSIPGSSIVAAIRNLKPQLVWLSASHISDRQQFEQEFQLVSESCDQSEVVFVIGGGVFDASLRKRLNYSFFGDTMKQLDTFTKSLLGRSSATN